MSDPFAEKTRPSGLAVLVVPVVAFGAAWMLGYAAEWIASLRTTASVVSPASSAAPAK
jgi:hypothetical protein